VIDSVSRFIKDVTDGEIQVTAAALSFTTVLALIPFIAVTLSVLQYVEGLETLYPKVENFVLSYFADPTGTQGIDMVKKLLQRIMSGKLGQVGALALLLTSTFLMFELERAVHRVWRIKNERPIYQRLFFYWIAIFTIPFFLAAVVSLNTKFVKSLIPLPVLHGGVLFVILYCFYRYVPSTKVSSLGALLGAGISVFGMSTVVTIFRYLSLKVFNHSKMYGSLAALPGLMLWILILWYIVLFGAAVTASFSAIKQTQKRSF
jgi:membrane protein